MPSWHCSRMRRAPLARGGALAASVFPAPPPPPASNGRPGAPARKNQGGRRRAAGGGRPPRAPRLALDEQRLAERPGQEDRGGQRAVGEVALLAQRLADRVR